MNDADFYIGKPIRCLQTMLRVIAAADEAIPQVVPDGIYGPDTEAAVTAFQARSGLPPTGEADQATWNRIVDAYLKLGSFVLPLEALRIRWQPQQSICAGEENLHLFPIQAMLAALQKRYRNLTAPPVDGRHGAQSVAAVQALQRLCGLPVSGSIDQTTWDHLCKLYALSSGDGECPAGTN